MFITFSLSSIALQALPIQGAKRRLFAQVHKSKLCDVLASGDTVRQQWQDFAGYL